MSRRGRRLSAHLRSLQLADAFLAFYVVTGVLLFAYCVLVTSYPFNAFLGACVAHYDDCPEARSFSSTVGQFVLLASLRIQANPANKAVFRDIAPERSVDNRPAWLSPRRAFAEFVFSSIVLHAFVFTFLCVLRRQNRSDIRSG